MLSYLNYFLLAVLVVFSVAQLKHDGKVTQKHFTGDWRQRLHEIIINHDSSDQIPLILSGLITFIFGIWTLAQGDSIAFSIALMCYSFGSLGLLSFFFSFCIITVVINILLYYIYYNPEGKYILEKDKLSGKYDIYECCKYPGGRNKIKIPQLIGQNNDLAFADKGEIFKQILKRNDCGIIIASFSEKTLSEYEKWLIRKKE